ncbi:homoserine O-acetyltransferase [Litchfieldella qijiaojingensis]|uniref:Serine O-succinyltransferase n=1 Tax=Litchfieldella qijiaojingensis TaxID=980347 RepID=A0ABQ2YNM6_9GAMM|nr:homoserine O-acetyltransferase [Halomonas qijiaojingensis]GGX87972.1 homoserine O-acetyltransferase [Halomonas qijiaojingensis]
MSDARRFVELQDPLRMYRGGKLPSVTIAYETWGKLRGRGDNALLLFTGLSPSAHAASSAVDPSPGWWEYMIGPGKSIDTERFFVIAINSLGSCFGSTGPASCNPMTGKPYRLDFPKLSVEDIVAAARHACRALGIDHVHTVAGSSLGGMDALAYAMMYPGTYRDIISISAAAQATPFAIALRSIQREAVRADPTWAGGNYAPDKGPKDGLRVARELGILTYRSAEEWLQRFDRERIEGADASADPFAMAFQVQSYMDANARKFADVFDANCFLYLSQAMDLFDMAEHGNGRLESAIRKVDAKRALVAGVTTDWLFPLWQQRQIAELLEHAGVAVSYHELESIQGHDAFLIDRERFAPMIAEFLAGMPDA